MIEKELIKLVANSKKFGLSKNCTEKITVHNRVCGDEITLGINKAKTEISFETKGCILTQASAVILTENFINLDKKKFDTYKKCISDVLKKKQKLPNELMEFNKILIKDFKNREECITLPFKACIKLLND